ncbi:hypothetical protein J6590_050029 [Homalodisca vitripennis]|nr:hypothetical protein J6590_050029 [Homalodisca vitripennis]
MPKGKYGTWSVDDMSRALQAFRNGDMGLNECFRQYGVPKPTLLRHLKGTNVKANEETKAFGRGSVLPPTVEKELVDHILKLETLMPELPSPQERLATTNTPTTKNPTEASPRLKISIDSISPIPKPHPESKKGTAPKAVVLTDSSYKKELELAKQLQLAQEHKRVSAPNIKLEGKPIYKKNKEAVKRNFAKKKCENPTKPVLLNAASSSKQADIVVEMCVDEWFCSICEENKIEDMIQCTKCLSWSHELCAGSEDHLDCTNNCKTSLLDKWSSLMSNGGYPNQKQMEALKSIDVVIMYEYTFL